MYTHTHMYVHLHTHTITNIHDIGKNKIKLKKLHALMLTNVSFIYLLMGGLFVGDSLT